MISKKENSVVVLLVVVTKKSLFPLVVHQIMQIFLNSYSPYNQSSNSHERLRKKALLKQEIGVIVSMEEEPKAGGCLRPTQRMTSCTN
jgi:hypothetical protein